METMNISLPDSLNVFVESQVAEGNYCSASEYVQELIRIDQKYKAADKLEAHGSLIFSIVSNMWTRY